jgi:hypothetical protein
MRLMPSLPKGRRRMISAIAITACLSVRLVASQADSVVAHSKLPTTVAQVIVVGCVAQAADGFFITGTSLDFGSAQRSTGSNSAKASTPVSRAHDSIVVRGSAGSNSSKASTPIRSSGAQGTTASSSGEQSTYRTATVTSAKGSVPVSRKALPEVSYQLEAARNLLPSRLDRVLEIRGTVQNGPPSGTTPTLKVDHVNMMSTTCGSRR